MKFTNYLKDKIISIVLFLLMLFIILLILSAFKISYIVIISLFIIINFFLLCILLYNFFRKKYYYNTLITNLELLDKKYLISEMIKTPSFYEGKILYQILYETNKSMLENIKEYEININNFKDYIEMWIHEIKIPIASLILIMHNKNSKTSKNINYEIKRIENYVEQILYYVRSENAEKDYLIGEVNLEKIIQQVALKNKDDLLNNKVQLIVDKIDYQILTDSKWLEFIVNQIINNSIKYKNDKDKSYIKISSKKSNDIVTLSIEDNGIGISKSDLPKVFDKTFTGKNGRRKNVSTGMGLYIAKKLCKKLGHEIFIFSKENEFTKVDITFSLNNYYDVLK